MPAIITKKGIFNVGGIDIEGVIMKISTMLGIMFMLATVGAQASTIILKDGRAITGDIIQQDKDKAVVKVNDVTLTYYKDDIVSIDGNPLAGPSPSDVSPSPSIESDPEKEKLAEQYLAYYPMSQVVSDWVKSNFSSDKQQIVLASLNNDQNISAWTHFRIQGVMQYFSSAELKAVIKFQSSAEGKQYFKDYIRYQKYIISKFYPKLHQEAQKAMGRVKAK